MQALLTSLQETQTIAIFTVLVLLLTWETLHPFFDFFRGSWQERGWHLARNLIVGALNSLLVALVFVGLWLAAALWADTHNFGVLNWLATSWQLPTWVHVAGAVFLLDAWMYIWHRINHRIPFLWRFHRVHHSDNKMDVTTASRFHIGEIFFSSLLRIPVILLTGIYAWELVLYETIMFAVVQFHHADVALPATLDQRLRAIIVTPGMHKVHHSRWQPETDSNYSSLFSFWDRLGGSFRMRDNLSELSVGLDAFDEESFQSLPGLLKTPLAPVVKSSKRPAERSIDVDLTRQNSTHSQEQVEK